MISDFIDFLFNLLNLFPSKNQEDSSRKKQRQNSLSLSILLVTISTIILIIKRSIFSSQNITSQVSISILIGFILSLCLIIGFTFSRVIKPLYISNFAILLISITTLFASILLVINDNINFL